MKRLTIFLVLSFIFLNIYSAIAQNNKNNNQNNSSSKHTLDILAERFEAKAICEGLCRDVKGSLDKNKTDILVRFEENGKNGRELEIIGYIYTNEDGKKAVCFDDRAFTPLREKSLHEKVIKIIGKKISGKRYGAEFDKAILPESMLADGESENNHNGD